MKVITRDRLYKTNINIQGEIMKIIEYNNCDNIVVEFEKTKTKKKCKYSNFIIGSVKDDNLPYYRKNRVGEIIKNNQNELMEIIEYNGSENIVVEFKDTKNKLKSTYSIFKDGAIYDYMFPFVCGIGYIGEVYDYGKISKEKSYTKWNSMISRCYGRNKNKAYKDVYVCDEWHNYSNFKKWFDENYYEIPNEKMCLDKDILSNINNRIYSPQTCVFVPEKINLLFIKPRNSTKNLPIGVCYDKERNKYLVNVGNKSNRYVGRYSNIDEASLNYRIEKKKEIIKIANMYKDKIPKRIYDIIINYEVK